VRRRRRPVILTTLLVAAVAVTAGVIVGVHRALAPDPGPGASAARSTTADWSYVIPRGTGARIARGEKPSILPARIDARVGQVIRIVNHDTRAYHLGPFHVGAGETLTQRFTSPGRFVGSCATNASGRLVLSVSG
jgi:hypothetical protein